MDAAAAGNLTAEFAALRHRVLVVDIGPQATLTTRLVGRTEAPGTAEALLDEVAADAVAAEVAAFGIRLLSAVPGR